MPILFLQRPEISESRWDTFIGSSPQRIVYAYSWYLDTVSPGWRALILEENGAWKAVMPLPVRKKWGTYVIQQPFFCQFLGVFVKKERDFQEASHLLLTALPDYFRYISIYTGRFSKIVSLSNGYEVNRCTTHLLPLHFPYPILKQNYTADRRLNLNRAERFQWDVQESHDLNPMLDLFRTYHSSQIEGGVSETAYQLLQKVAEVLYEKKAGRLLYAIKDGKIEAGAFFVIFEKRIIYLFNAASALGRKGNARTRLIDRMVQEYAETDFVFDFESPEVKSIADFYQSFGAQKEEYLSLHYNQLPFPLKQFQNWRRKRVERLKEKRVKRKKV
ncbi:MAG: GNAT family N-acetyltransferase [Spirosomataceae bacterium]